MDTGFELDDVKNALEHRRLLLLKIRSELEEGSESLRGIRGDLKEIKRIVVVSLKLVPWSLCFIAL